MNISTRLAAILCSGLLLVTASPSRASDDDLVYPKLDCYSIVSADEYVFYFGTHSNKTSDAAPAINFFDPPSFTPPGTIKPGYTPHVFSVTVDPSVNTQLIWFLGSGAPLQVLTASLGDEKLCGIGLQGPQGDPGPAGPQGDPGPTGLEGCRTVTESVAEGVKPAVALAACDADEQVVSGEGACGRGAIASFGRVGNAWQVTCQRPKGVTSTALCCPL